MNSLRQAGTSWCSEVVTGWNRFWFTPSAPHTLALMRILAGAMLLYTHLVWAKDLIAFLVRTVGFRGQHPSNCIKAPSLGVTFG